MTSREELLRRTDEEWTAVYESGGAEYWEDRATLYQIQLTDAKVENERLGKLVKRYYGKHHEAVMADAVRVEGGFTDCLCDMCEEVRRTEATDETRTA